MIIELVWKYFIHIEILMISFRREITDYLNPFRSRLVLYMQETKFSDI
jgi:hypothetical protein